MPHSDVELDKEQHLDPSEAENEQPEEPERFEDDFLAAEEDRIAKEIDLAADEDFEVMASVQGMISWLGIYGFQR
jgi:hypothetical protein